MDSEYIISFMLILLLLVISVKNNALRQVVRYFLINTLA